MKLIKINTNHYIVVDNSLDFSETDYYWDDKQKEIRTGSNNHVTGGYKIKITHSTRPFGGSATAISLHEVKELIGEVDVEKKAKENYVEPLNKQGEKRAQLVGNGGLFGFNKFKKAFKKGYNQALEDNNEKKYTNEDMLTIRNQLVTMLPVGDVAAWDMIQAISKYTKWLDEYIESLQPKTEWEIEFINGKLKLK